MLYFANVPMPRTRHLPNWDPHGGPKLHELDPPDPMGYVCVDCERKCDAMMGRKSPDELLAACREVREEMRQAKDWGKDMGLRSTRTFLFGHPWVLQTDAPETIVVALERYRRVCHPPAWCLNCYLGVEPRQVALQRANLNRTAIDWTYRNITKRAQIVAAVSVVTGWQSPDDTRLLDAEQVETAAMMAATSRPTALWLWSSHRWRVKVACWPDHPDRQIQANIESERSHLRSCYGVDPTIGEEDETMAKVDSEIQSRWEALRHSFSALMG
jgi:hypothetical protein